MAAGSSSSSALGVIFFTLLGLILVKKGAAPVTGSTVSETLTVLPIRIRIRTEPNARAPVVATASSGERLTLVEDRGAWVRVQTSEGLSGWAERANLERTAEQERRTEALGDDPPSAAAQRRGDQPRAALRRSRHLLSDSSASSPKGATSPSTRAITTSTPSRTATASPTPTSMRSTSARQPRGKSTSALRAKLPPRARPTPPRFRRRSPTPPSSCHR